MNNLYAVLIAINQYPNPAHCLRGCVNDRNLFEAMLKERYGQTYHLHIKTLTNEEASRNNIIESFDWFLLAKDKDLCLFFYAGHGSQMPAPTAFHHLESDRYLETMVCYDSRQDEGRNLADKELSYLIWKASQNKDIQFVAIMDCCHSGTITRDEEDLHITSRNVNAREDGFLKEDFIGHEHYQMDKAGNFTPPRARHILLSAAQASETAKEVRASGIPRGVFTFSLLEALEKANRPLSYADLMQKATFRIRALVRKQTPRLDADVPSDKRLAFLSDDKVSNTPHFYISHDREKGWIINAGAIHGIKQNRHQGQPFLKLKKENKELAIKNVFATYSTLEGMDGMFRKNQYEAILLNQVTSAVTYGFSSNADFFGKKMLLDAYDQYQPELFTLQHQDSGADYLIYAEQHSWYLTLPFSKQPLFQATNLYNEDGAIDFIKRLEAVAKWRQVMDLKEPHSSIEPAEFMIQAERITEVGNYTYDAEGEMTSWQAPIAMNYQLLNGVWYRPAFRLKLKNTGRRKLWFSTLYLGSRFGISNILLPGVALKPGEEQWLEDRMAKYPTNAIQLWISDDDKNMEDNTIREYLKIFVSSDPLTTDDLNQEDLPPPDVTDHRGFGEPPHITSSGWTTREIELAIHRPQESF